MKHRLSDAELLADPNVLAGMRRAFDDSDVGGPQPMEQGGFLVRDPQTGIVTVIRLASSGRDSLRYPLCPTGLYQGQEIVGSFHTHPNTGPEWRQEPTAEASLKLANL